MIGGIGDFAEGVISTYLSGVLVDGVTGFVGGVVEFVGDGTHTFCDGIGY